MNTAAAPLTRSDRKVDRLLAHYGESHQNPTNEAIHMVAIPAIMFSIVGLLYALHPWVAYAFVAASLVYYAMLRSPAFLVTMLVGTIDHGLATASWLAEAPDSVVIRETPSFLAIS